MKAMMILSVTFFGLLSNSYAQESKALLCTGQVVTNLYQKSSATNSVPKVSKIVLTRLSDVNSDGQIGNYGFTVTEMKFDRTNVTLEIRNSKGFTIGSTLVSAAQLDLGVSLALPIEDGKVILTCNY